MSNYPSRQFRSDGNEFRELDRQGKYAREPSGDILKLLSRCCSIASAVSERTNVSA